MKLGVQFDENGQFVSDFLEGMTLPEGHTLYEGEITEGLFSPKLVNGEVVEGLTQAEIDEKKNVPTEPTPMETLQKNYADLTFELMIKGVL